MDAKLKKGHSPGQPEDRKRQCLQALTNVYYVLRKYPHANLDNGILSKLGIKYTSSLEEAKPRYFEPFDNDTFEELWAQAEIAAQADPEYDCDWPTFYLSSNGADAYHLDGFLDRFCGRWPKPGMMLDQHGPWKGRHMDSSFLEHCLGCAPGGEHHCTIPRVYDNAKTGAPHLGCTIIDEAEMDERLLWSEVLSAASLMARKLLKKQNAKIQSVPVFVITLAGKKARVLQAHFDTQLVIQKSDIIDLSKENYEGVKYLVRWMMCRPMGL